MNCSTFIEPQYECVMEGFYPGNPLLTMHLRTYLSYYILRHKVSFHEEDFQRCSIRVLCRVHHVGVLVANYIIDGVRLEQGVNGVRVENEYSLFSTLIQLCSYCNMGARDRTISFIMWSDNLGAAASWSPFSSHENVKA